MKVNLAIAIVLVAHSVGLGVVVTPTGVTHSDADFSTNSLNLINGNGLSNPGNPLASTHAGAGFVFSNVWLANGGAGAGAAGDAQLEATTLTFDFASAKDLSAVHLWQYTQGTGCCQGRAVDAMTVSFSTDNGGSFSNDVSLVLPAPDNGGGTQLRHTLGFGSTIENVTNVRFTNMSDNDAGANSGFIGFSEVRFDAVVERGSVEIVDGSFENPNHGGGATAGLNPAFGNWSNVGGQGNLGHLDSGFVSASTPDGSGQWLYFRDELGVAQQIGDVADLFAYEISFDQSTQTNIGNTGGGVEISLFAGDPNLGGTLLDIVGFDSVAPGDVLRRIATLETGLGFEGQQLFLVLQHDGVASNVLIDDLRVDRITQIVPEPTTAGIGLLVMAGFAGRRRRRCA